MQLNTVMSNKDIAHYLLRVISNKQVMHIILSSYISISFINRCNVNKNITVNTNADVVNTGSTYNITKGVTTY
jgi:hypothetical protein